MSLVIENLTRKVTLPVDASQVDKFLSEPFDGLGEVLGKLDGPVMVLGAGGKMGLHVSAMIKRADESVARKRDVIAVSRFSTVHGREAFHDFGVETLACDLEDPAALAGLPDVPNVIFMAGAKFGTGDNPDILHRMNVELPQKIAARFAGARIIAFSTGCVYPMVSPESGGCTEEDVIDPPGEYAISCAGREKAFEKSAHEQGTKVALIRLNYSTEFRYGVLVDIARKVYDGIPVTTQTGYVNLIWQRDAVDHILRAFPLANAGPYILNVTGTQAWRVRDLAGAFGYILDRQPIFEGTEAPTAWLNNASKSHKLFGTPPTSIQQMLEWTAAWVISGGGTFGKPTGFENRTGKF